MSTLTVPTSSTDTAVAAEAGPSTTRRRGLASTTIAVGLGAAAVVTGVAAVAHAAGVPLEVDGEMIPIAGFAQMTFLGAVLGALLLAGLDRWSAAPRRRFLQVAVALTTLSCVPSLALPPDAATRATLVATHVIAAAIVIPVLARRARA